MVEISKYGSGEGPGRVTCPGYSTAMRHQHATEKPSCGNEGLGTETG